MQNWEDRLNSLNRLIRYIKAAFSDENFLYAIARLENLVSKVLSIAMLMVILVAVYDLSVFLILDFVIPELSNPNYGGFGSSLFNIFGLFLNVLIALEILENITAYLKRHVIQVELVISTSLIAVARKIIILDLSKTTALDVIGLAAAIASLSASYWIIRRINRRNTPTH